MSQWPGVLHFSLQGGRQAVKSEEKLPFACLHVNNRDFLLLANCSVCQEIV